MTDYTEIIKIAIQLVIALITLIVLPKLKTFLDCKVDEDDLKTILEWVKIAVEAAEQIYKQSGMGKVKKEYVENFLASKGIYYDKDEIDALIESAVFNLNEERKKKGLVLLDESEK